MKHWRDILGNELQSAIEALECYRLTPEHHVQAIVRMLEDAAEAHRYRFDDEDTTIDSADYEAIALGLQAEAIAEMEAQR